MIFPIEKMCLVLKVSRSAYYDWLRCKVSKRALENKEITNRILFHFHASRQTYGSPMITAALRRESVSASRPRVARLMQMASIQSVRRRKFVVTTDSKHKYPVADNKLDRNFKSDILGQTWVSDITYVPTAQGWLYLTTVMDIADRKVIGWALSETMMASVTSVAAFKMAVKNRPLTRELIFHSDRGIQYACTEFKSLLEGNKSITRSMSRKGNCWDNAVAESFFKTIKSDLVYQTKFTSIQEAKSAIFEYIEIWYNRNRMHSSLNYKTPQEMEAYLFRKAAA